MTNYFISDIHLGHKNCLAFDNRQFPDIESHDRAIIGNWNNTINIDDDIYILGDVSWYNVTTTIKIFEQLNGRKHLIVGNHDNKFLKNRDFRNLFVEIAHYKELSLDNGKVVVLCHYPIPTFNHHHHGSYHLYGHVHNSYEWKLVERMKYEMEYLYEKPCHMYNCGAMMDYMGFTPRTLDEILEACGDKDLVSTNQRENERK